jgi:cystathionine gamma-synthase
MPLRPETLAAKAVHAIDAATGAIAPPIHLATTYARDANYALIADRDYARDKNPTFLAAETTLAALEHGAEARIFSSGMAAATVAIRSIVKPGDHIIAPRVGYYALRNWLARFCAKWHVGLDTVDMTDLTAVRATIRKGETRLVWIETPANPTWDLTDIVEVAKLAHDAQALVVVDSTCATPVLTQPLTLGADLVMHSATKYLGGHSDVLAGALVTKITDVTWNEITQTRRDEGAVLGPLEAYLLVRGMRTLFPRVERQSRTAQTLAERLSQLPGVSVHYPGLRGHPQHGVAQTQMKGGYGGMLSIRVGDRDPLDVVRKLGVWLPATSLGGVESLVEHRASVEGPTSPTPKDLLRLSVGLEHEEDLFEDLRQALA